ncbi:cyclodeaminase/cyclohydrolase family protein [Desulfomonile tiedjei]|uniref:Methenyl tetrahydrofolate cyclohydrolase n=1 Tax=Desulfomonile tiedjei (strain ATCC 49306 / DSM 6799 / DCB-1) TaxID=706587 RepID=I4C646_DESTA|nr:cyclodeaminase/cyclohydrolase family protein [Desulfomonile tiedjei]AFM25037.1 methenyl tetrahydrofolate cyclohydrolase [Desulfomonile tiedjei DSM 6799]
MKDAFLEALSRPRPDPGGGAASAYGALLSVAIVEKIVRIELQRNENSGSESVLTRMLSTVVVLQKDCAQWCEQDVQAYLELARVRKAGITGSELISSMESAVECPLNIMQSGLRILKCIADVGSLCRKHLISDLQVAAEFARAAIYGASHITSANLLLMRERGHVSSYEQRFQTLLDQVETQFNQTMSTLGA